jgi:lysophospholipase L1-like esterase
VLFGANDACLPIPTNKQGVPLGRYKANLRSIITHPNITAHKPKILLVTPPPLDQTRLTVWDTVVNKEHEVVTRHAAISALYSEAARQVAAEVPGTILIDLQKAIMDKAVSMTPDMTPEDYDADGSPLLGYPDKKRGGLEQLLPDGLHMSGDAYRVFYDLVKGHFGPFPGIMDKDLETTEFPNALPGWSILHPL